MYDIKSVANGGYVLKIEFEQKLRALQARKDDPVALDAFCHEQDGLRSERLQATFYSSLLQGLYS